jgi:RimJ/RimL family protein N-acetyltransferase
MFKALNNFKYAKKIYEINNDKDSRKFSFSKKKFTYKSHLLWLDKILKKKQTNIYLYFSKKNIIGTIKSERKKDFNHLSWALVKKYRGKNYGKKILKLFVKKFGKKFIAKVHANNIASLKMCDAAGFVLYKKVKKFYYFKKS